MKQNHISEALTCEEHFNHAQAVKNIINTFPNNRMLKKSCIFF